MLKKMEIRHKYLVIAFSCFFLAFTFFTMLATSAIGAEARIQVSWIVPEGAVGNITYWQVINHNNVIVADNVPPEDRSADFMTDGEPGGWRVRGVFIDGDGNEFGSDPSTTTLWQPPPDPCPECPPCPEDPPVLTPTVMTVTGTVTGTLVIEKEDKEAQPTRP